MDNKAKVLSQGRGAKGPGVRIIKEVLNPTRDRGWITAWLYNVNTTTMDTAAAATLPNQFPGKTLPLANIDVRLLKAGRAMAIGYYSQASVGAGGFRRVLQVTPTITRTRLVYDYAGNDRAENRTERGEIIPQKVPVNGRVIQWSSVVYSDARPNLRVDLDDTICSDDYLIDGYLFPGGSLRFNGMSVTHEKYAAYDRWTRYYSATFDPFFWKNQKQTDDPGPNGTVYTPDGEELAIPQARFVSWPDLP